MDGTYPACIACIACMLRAIAFSVSRSGSVGLNAGLVDLLVVWEAECQAALQHVAPERALAAVARQAAQERVPSMSAANDTKLIV